MSVTTTVLFQRPQQEIATLTRCVSLIGLGANILKGFKLSSMENAQRTEDVS